MRRNPKLFTPEEFDFLHKTLLGQREETKLFKRIKAKRGYDLDKREIDLVKKRFQKWKTDNPSYF